MQPPHKRTDRPKGPINGSVPIKNFRHERFAQFMARGFSPTESYEKAGFTPNAQNAYRCKRNPEVKARMAYLLEKAAQKSIVDAAYIRDQLGRVVELALSTEINQDGVEVLAPTGNLGAANRALELLGREHGMFKDKVELSGEVNTGSRELIRRLTPEQRKWMRAVLTSTLAQRPANDDNGETDEAESA